MINLFYICRKLFSFCKYIHLPISTLCKFYATNLICLIVLDVYVLKTSKSRIIALCSSTAASSNSTAWLQLKLEKFHSMLWEELFISITMILATKPFWICKENNPMQQRVHCLLWQNKNMVFIAIPLTACFRWKQMPARGPFHHLAVNNSTVVELSWSILYRSQKKKKRKELLLSLFLHLQILSAASELWLCSVQHLKGRSLLPNSSAQRVSRRDLLRQCYLFMRQFCTRNDSARCGLGACWLRRDGIRHRLQCLPCRPGRETVAFSLRESVWWISEVKQHTVKFSHSERSGHRQVKEEINKQKKSCLYKTVPENMKIKYLSMLTTSSFKYHNQQLWKKASICIPNS